MLGLLNYDYTDFKKRLHGFQNMEEKDSLTEKIIACCFRVHSELGAGFNEKIYHNALKLALQEERIKYQTEKQFEVFFKDEKVGSLKLDLIVEDRVIVEIKAVTSYIPDVFKHQLLSYLKVTGLHIGLLVNFGNKSCQVKRFVF